MNTTKPETKSILAYSLMDYSTAMQEAILEGYRLDNSNEGYPQQIGALYSCNLLLDDVLTVKKVTKVVNEAETKKDADNKKEPKKETKDNNK